MKHLKPFQINEEDTFYLGDNEVTKGGRYTDSDLEKQRLSKFDIQKAFVKQIPNEVIDRKDGERILGVVFDTDESPQIARAFTVDNKGRYGMITYRFNGTTLEPIIASMVQSLDEIKDNIKKFTY